MSLKKCTNWAVNQPVDVAKKHFSGLFLSSLGWAEENILVPDCYTLIPLIHYVQCSGYTVTRLQCKVFQINRINVLASVFLSQPTQSLCLQDCVQSVGGQMWIWGAFLRGRSSLRYSAPSAATFSHFHSTQHHGELLQQSLLSTQFSAMQYYVYIRLAKV